MQVAVDCSGIFSIHSWLVVTNHGYQNYPKVEGVIRFPAKAVLGANLLLYISPNSWLVVTVVDLVILTPYHGYDTLLHSVLILI